MRWYIRLQGSEKVYVPITADVMSVDGKCIVVRFFVCRVDDNILIETRKFSYNLRVTQNGVVSGFDRGFRSSNSTFQNVSDRLNPLQKRT